MYLSEYFEVVISLDNLSIVEQINALRVKCLNVGFKLTDNKFVSRCNTIQGAMNAIDNLVTVLKDASIKITKYSITNIVVNKRE